MAKQVSMLFTNITYLGIDPTTVGLPMVYIALDDSLELLAVGQGSLEDVLAFVAGQQQALVAVCAPRQPNLGMMAQDEIRQSLSPQPSPGRWLNFRVCEYLLRKHNIHIPRTPGVGEKAPGWMQTSFKLFQRLAELDYLVYPGEVGELETRERVASRRQYLEVYPHASFSTLLGRTPFPKNTLEGRLQRQLVLYNLNINVPDPMLFFEEITSSRLLRGILPTEDLYSPNELDALVGAYTAWLAARKPDEISRIGDSLEGEIILPVKNLTQRYS